MILVRPGSAVSEALRVLESSGVSPVWSELSQTVYLSDFVSSEPVRLEEALGRLLPEDPRRTPWLDGLLGFYRVGEKEGVRSVLYVPASQSSRACRALSRSLPPDAWISIDRIRLGGAGLLWIPGMLLIGFTAYRTPRRTWRAIAAALPWLPLWLSGRIPAVLGGLWGYTVVFERIEDSSPEFGSILTLSWRRTAVRFLPQTVTWALLGLFDAQALPGMILSLASSICLILGLEGLEAWKASRRIHAVFVALPLDTRMVQRVRARTERQRARSAFAACLTALAVQGILPGIVANPVGGNPALPPLPLPGPSIAARSINAQTVERIVQNKNVSGLPSLADAVAHRAYQEALPYSRIGSRAYGSLDSAVLERFRPEGEKVVRIRETTREFNDSWFRKVLREETKTGIGAVLADQVGIVSPRIGYLEKGAISESLALRDVFFYIILLTPAVLGAVWKGIGFRFIQAGSPGPLQGDERHSHL